VLHTNPDVTAYCALTGSRQPTAERAVIRITSTSS